MTDVLSVVQNWKRPANVARVVDAIRSQSVASKLAIVDCAIEPEYALPPDVLAKADYVFCVERANLGPCCRFIPSLMIPQIPLTMFWLDDFLPGPRCLESFLRHRNVIELSDFSTLGQDGRRFDAGLSIIRRRTLAHDGLTFVDVVVSSELCLTRNVARALTFRNLLVDEYGADAISLDEDDLYLCLGIRRFLKSPSAVFAPRTPDESGRAVRLPSPFALSAREDHDARRAGFVRKAMKWVQSP